MALSCLYMHEYHFMTIRTCSSASTACCLLCFLSCVGSAALWIVLVPPGLVYLMWEFFGSISISA